MTAGKDLSPGYLLKITTWENDADNYNTVETAGIQTTDEINFYIAIATLFESCHGTHRGSAEERRYGNSECGGETYDPKKRYQRTGDATLVEDIKRVVDEYLSKGYRVPDEWNYHTWDKSRLTGNETWDVDYNWYSDILYDFGITRWGEGEYWRVFESFEVFFVPSEIQNVTTKFT